MSCDFLEFIIKNSSIIANLNTSFVNLVIEVSVRQDLYLIWSNSVDDNTLKVLANCLASGPFWYLLKSIYF